MGQSAKAISPANKSIGDHGTLEGKGTTNPTTADTAPGEEEDGRKKAVREGVDGGKEGVRKGVDGEGKEGGKRDEAETASERQRVATARDGTTPTSNRTGQSVAPTEDETSEEEEEEEEEEEKRAVPSEAEGAHSQGGEKVTESDKELVPKEGSPRKPSTRDPHRHAHYARQPMYPPYPHQAHMLHLSQVHNGYPTSDPDMYRYPPHMRPMPPGYGMRSSERGHPHPMHRPNDGSSSSAQPAADKEKGPNHTAETGDERGIPLAQRMVARNEMGVSPGYGMPPREGFPPGYGQRPDMEMGMPPGHGWPMDNEQGLSPGYNSWHHQHSYPFHPPPSPMGECAVCCEGDRGWEVRVAVSVPDETCPFCRPCCHDTWTEGEVEDGGNEAPLQPSSSSPPSHAPSTHSGQ